MKTQFFIFLLTCSLIQLSACNSSKDQKSEPEKNGTENIKTHQSKSDFITGIVTEIQPGKDGYTAKIRTAAGHEFFGTISRANLTDPTTYKTLQIGDSVTLKGDHWQMENQNHITVREIQ